MNKIIAINETDKALLEALSRGHGAGTKKVYDLALPSVIDWVCKNNGSESDARDIFQEALIALFIKLDKGDFELTCTLKSFLRIVCRNLWLTRLRDSKANKTSPLDGIEHTIEDDMTDIITETDRQRLFINHFNQLGADCRQLLRLFFDKISFAEIAVQLNTSVGYIKKKKFKCKERLVTAIQHDPLFKELNKKE